MRRASRSAAAVSRAIHFLRTSPARTGSVAAVAVRSQTGKNALLQILIFF